MILLFLGSWRSTLIVAISIPLSILPRSIIVLGSLGHTINMMTLGGLALAVGILVDDATVEIENIHRNLGHGQTDYRRRSSTAPSRSPCRRSSRRCASASCSCRWCSLTGAAQYLFVPLALAVVFAMLASYLLSRTLVPTMVQYLLRGRSRQRTPRATEHAGGGLIWRLHDAFDRRLRALARALPRRAGMGAASIAALVRRCRLAWCSLACRCFARWSARTSFRSSTPASSGCTCARRRARASRRPSSFFGRRRSRASARSIPTDEIGADARQHRHAVQRHQPRRSATATIGSADGEILVVAPNRSIAARRRVHARAAPRAARRISRTRRSSSSRADIVTQVLNFGLPAPIDVQVVGSIDAGRELRDRAASSRQQIARDPRRGRRPPPPGRRRARRCAIDVDRTRPRSSA